MLSAKVVLKHLVVSWEGGEKQGGEGEAEREVTQLQPEETPTIAFQLKLNFLHIFPLHPLFGGKKCVQKVGVQQGELSLPLLPEPLT